MMHIDLTFKLLHIQMGIYFGGQYGFVPQHLLHMPDIGPSLQKVGGETVAENVGADRFDNAGLFSRRLYYMEDHNPGKPLAAIIEEQYIIYGGTGGTGKTGRLSGALL